MTIKEKNRGLLGSFGVNKNLKKRIFNWAPIIAFVLAFTGSQIVPGIVSATGYGQITSRSIKMSNSAISATSVKYLVTFTTATTGNIRGVVVDFCSQASDPIIGDTCTAPTGFTVGSTVTAANTGLNPTASSSWTPTSINSGRTFEFQDATGASVSSGSIITIEITGNTNTSTLGTFYARIFTFATAADVTTWNGVSNGSGTTNIVDAGGIALATVNQITITAKVQETITFCVYTSAYDSGLCTGTGTSVTLGSGNGVLSSATSWTDPSTKYDIQTNASNGAAVRFTTSGTFGTLYSGTNHIDFTPGTSGTCATNTSCTYSLGTNQFGFCSYSPTGATITVSAPYNGSNCSVSVLLGAGANASTANFGLDEAAAEGTYGSQIATVTAGATAEGVLDFLGGVSVTQPAGVYQVVLTFIATGTY